MELTAWEQIVLAFTIIGFGMFVREIIGWFFKTGAIVQKLDDIKTILEKNNPPKP